MAPTVSRGNKPRASRWQGIRSLRCTATAVTLLSLLVPVGFSKVRVNVVANEEGGSAGCVIIAGVAIDTVLNSFLTA